jgi:hypothetical protein
MKSKGMTAEEELIHLREENRLLREQGLATLHPLEVED